MSAGIEQGGNLIWEHDTGLLFEELKSTLPRYVELRNNLLADENATTQQAKQVLAALNHPVFTEYSDAIKGSAAPQKKRRQLHDVTGGVAGRCRRHCRLAAKKIRASSLRRCKMPTRSTP
ncbi:hypothetical protein CWS02_19030 [Enterobacter sp. EA-1]|nr:hypothetical protein CWS02_19030 [Enterobacter sp. EA-1]